MLCFLTHIKKLNKNQQRLYNIRPFDGIGHSSLPQHPPHPPPRWTPPPPPLATSLLL